MSVSPVWIDRIRRTGGGNCRIDDATMQGEGAEQSGFPEGRLQSRGFKLFVTLYVAAELRLVQLATSRWHK